MLGLRLAYAYFGARRGVPYSIFLGLFDKSEQLFTVGAVLTAIRTAVSSERLFIALHIDEVQKIFEQESLFPIDAAGRGIFKQLM